MRKIECRRTFYTLPLFAFLIAAALLMGACTTPEKAKAQHVARGQALLKEKKFQEASLEFRSALQIDEKLADAHWGLANAYEGLQRYQEAFDEMRLTAELDPNNLDVRVRLGNYYLVGSKQSSAAITEAERLAKEVLEKDPNHIEGHILMGSVLFAQDKKSEAFAELNHAVELNPKRVESYLSLARFYVLTKDLTTAEATYQRAISVSGGSALAHYEYGKFLVGANRPDVAESEFQQAVQVDPNNREARFILASFYLVNKRFDKAEESYKALAELDKDKPEGRSVFATLTVEENLELTFRRSRGRGGVRDALEHAYSLFPRLGERRKQTAGTLSGGEQRMLSLSRVLVERPRLLIADELSLGLAPIIVDEVYRTLERIRDSGTTLLLVEQHVHHALEIADDAVVLIKGEVSVACPVSELGDIQTRLFGTD